VNRWAACPAIVVAVLGVAAVFGTHLVSQTELGWRQTAAVICFGLAAVAALMILIEGNSKQCESSSSEPGAAGG
jgi:hypothetical protein